MIEQLAIRRSQRVDGQRFPRFDQRVRDFFKLGKHRLANDRPADTVDHSVDEISAFVFVACLLHQVPGEQLLVERAGDFGDENGVVVILIGLGLRRVIAVHGVASFMGEREDMIQHGGLKNSSGYTAARRSFRC